MADSTPEPTPSRRNLPSPKALFVIGLIVGGYGGLSGTFSCMMVTDATCGERAWSSALIFLVIGGLLIAAAIVSAVQRRR